MSAVTAMLVAAWAQAETCDLLVIDGMLQMSARYEPSLELLTAFGEERLRIIGLLGWGLPLRRSEPSRQSLVSVVQWPTRGTGRFGRCGAS